MTWPETSSWVVGEVVPIPTLPFWSTMKAVLVEKAAVEVATTKAGEVPPAEPLTESLAQGEVVPIPTNSFVSRKRDEVAVSSLVAEA